MTMQPRFWSGPEDEEIRQAMEDQIPKGIYCYDKHGLCPWFDAREDKPEQECGYCHYLEAGDWEENGTFLLWDQVKECGLNDDDEEWEENESEEF